MVADQQEVAAVIAAEDGAALASYAFEKFEDRLAGVRLQLRERRLVESSR